MVVADIRSDSGRRRPRGEASRKGGRDEACVGKSRSQGLKPRRPGAINLPFRSSELDAQHKSAGLLDDPAHELRFGNVDTRAEDYARIRGPSSALENLS